MNKQMAEPSAPLLDPKIWDGALYLNGWKKGAQMKTEVTEKATGVVLARVATGDVGDIAEACRIADIAGPQWAATPISDRIAIIRRAGELLGQYREEAVSWLIREAGSSKVNAEIETELTEAHFRSSTNVADSAYRTVVTDSVDSYGYFDRMPLGVVGVIGHFDFPLFVGARSVTAAIATGNTVVLKPSLHTTVSGGVLIARLFEEAGLPRGVLHVIPGDGAAGAALVGHPLVRTVAFTGSTTVGRRIGAAAGGTLKRVSLELGGKASFVVLKDADIELASRAGAFGTFLRQGQLGMSAGLHLVPRNLMDDYAARVAALARDLSVGDPWRHSVAMGPMINEKRRDTVHHLVKDAVDAGALLIEGGTYDGLFYRPTVLANVPRTSRAYKEGVFGPVAVIVGYSQEEDAIQVANHLGAGGSCGIYGELNHARQFARRIEARGVHINDSAVIQNAGAPFSDILETYTTLRWVTENRNLQPATRAAR